MILERLKPHRTPIVVLTAFAAIGGVFCFDSIPQDPAYHHFADSRAVFGIPNAGDVISNLLYFIMGAIGLAAAAGKQSASRLLWLAFFGGVTLTAFGSAYYHLAPDNHRLVWDRLPVTIAFMSLFSLIILERVDTRAGLFFFPFLLATGLFSV